MKRKGLIESTSKSHEQLSIAFPPDFLMFDKIIKFLLKSDDLLFLANKKHFKGVSLPKAIDVGLTMVFQDEFADYCKKSKKKIDEDSREETDGRLKKAEDELKKM
ncbi:hypothetical protein QYF36_017057 [Acer negundo]|nr:hypothetical protein QYF36_017057 [Acer negundo]